MPTPLRWIVVAYCTCALVWGTTWYAVRASIAPGGYAPMESAAIRFALATLILLPLALRARPWPRTGVQIAWLVAAGILDAISYALIYLGEERVPGGLAAVLFATQPLVMATLLTVTGMERIGKNQVIGALVSLVGVSTIFVDRVDVSPRQAVGVAFVLGSCVLSTTYALMLKRHGGGIHSMASTWIFLAVTAVGLWIAVLVGGDVHVPWPPPAQPTIALVYLAAIGSVLAFATYIWLIDRVKMMTVGTLSFVLPVIALVVDAFFERAIRLEPRAYGGIALTLAGLAVSLLLRPRPAAAA